MAKADVEAVFSELEKVFSGEKIYDECLMELGLHTAQVRKQWPSLFKALSNLKNGLDLPTIKVGEDEFLNYLRKAIGVDKQTISSLASGHVDEQVREDVIKYSDYSEWSIGPVHDMKLNEEQWIKWDVEGAPMPSVTMTFTLRGSNARTRCLVKQVEGDVMLVSKVASLPLQG